MESCSDTGLRDLAEAQAGVSNTHKEQKMRTKSTTLQFAWSAFVLAVILAVGGLTASAETGKKPRAAAKPVSSKAAPPGKAKAVPASDNSDEVTLLKQQLALQQKQIERLSLALEDQKRMLEQVLQNPQASTQQAPNLGQVASLQPEVPRGKGESQSQAATLALPATPAGAADPVTQEQMQGYTKKVDQLDKTVGALNKGLAGFKFSGDFRLRSDNVFRSANSVAGPQQNIRGRYRLRFNVDRAVNDQTDVHLQLGSGTFNSPLTFDSDFNGSVARGPIFLSEAWGVYHPNKNFGFRGGRMSEVFADNARFLIDDDVRLDGFQEIAKAQTTSGSLGKVTFEVRAAQYIFTNPNVQVLPTAAQCSGANPPAQCAYVAAGFEPGQKVPSTNLFDQGFVVTASTSDNVTHQVTANFELWRNPNSIQLASLASGFPLLANSFYGVILAGPIGGAGNGTTTKGGAIFTADNFHIGQVVYRLDYRGWKTHRQGFPVSLELHAAKNFGADFYDNTLMGQISAGETKKFGDVAFKYGFFYKQANSMISQLTDDDVGTGTGVNLRTHMIRFDIGLNKLMAWQNLLFIQNELAGNDPARNFYVNVVKGTGTQYRLQSQLQFTF
jgi:hypothetical protein